MSVLLDMFEDDELDDVLGVQQDNDCSVCGCQLDDTKVTLVCNHSFCYDCLLQSYQGKSCQYNSNSKINRQCPYCRSATGYLPLPEGAKPIKGIHKEYQSKSAKKNTIEVLCPAILKSGPRKGQPCNCKCLYGKTVCGRHKNWTPTVA